MPLILDSGINEVEDPGSLPDNVLQEATGAEYRVGRKGIFVARGRTSRGTVSSSTLTGLYRAAFDSGTDWLLGQSGTNLQYAKVQSSMTFASLASPGGTAPFTGVHYANRHYLANGSTTTVVYESGSLPVTRKMGMAPATAAVGTSITQGAGSISTTTGLQYWVTEYDSGNGLESIFGSTVATGAFSSKDSVVLTITGVSNNSNATHWRVYRTADGGAWPDGGLITSLAIGTTTYTDSDTTTGTVPSPGYGAIEIGGLDFSRDIAPPTLYSVTAFQDSLVGFDAADRRSLRFTPAGYPESWPTVYTIPLQTEQHDQGTVCVEINGFLLAFTEDTIHRVVRLPREIDAAFAAGEALSRITNERGCVSRRGAALLTLPGSGSVVAFVARDGIWVTNGSDAAPIPLTDVIDWDSRVDVSALSSARLTNDPRNRRLIFVYRKPGSSVNNGVMYLDYQREAFRVTNADHGKLADVVTAKFNGSLQIFSADSRAGNGAVYSEADKDKDDSLVVDAAGSVSFAIRTAEIFPAGPANSASIEEANWLHGTGPSLVTHQFYKNRTTHPEERPLNFASREVTSVGIRTEVNSFSLRLHSTGTTSYGVHWVDVLPVERVPQGGRDGA